MSQAQPPLGHRWAPNPPRTAPNTTPRPRQPPAVPGPHSLGCRRVGPAGRGAQHGGDGEALLQPGEDPPAPRGQRCGGRANIASDKRRGLPHPAPAPTVPGAAPERRAEAERRRRAQCPRVPQRGPLTSPQAAGAGRRHLAEPPWCTNGKVPCGTRFPRPRRSVPAARGPERFSGVPPTAVPPPAAPGPGVPRVRGSRRLPAPPGEVTHGRGCLKASSSLLHRPERGLRASPGLSRSAAGQTGPPSPNQHGGGS